MDLNVKEVSQSVKFDTIKKIMSVIEEKTYSGRLGWTRWNPPSNIPIYSKTRYSFSFYFGGRGEYVILLESSSFVGGSSQGTLQEDYELSLRDDQEVFLISPNEFRGVVGEERLRKLWAFLTSREESVDLAPILQKLIEHGE